MLQYNRWLWHNNLNKICKRCLNSSIFNNNKYLPRIFKCHSMHLFLNSQCQVAALVECKHHTFKLRLHMLWHLKEVICLFRSQQIKSWSHLHLFNNLFSSNRCLLPINNQEITNSQTLNNLLETTNFQICHYVHPLNKQLNPNYFNKL